MAFRHVYTEEEQIPANDTQTPVEQASLKTLLFASLNRIKAITGLNYWSENPPATLQDVANHINSRDGHPLATDTQNGFLSGADKTKIDNMDSISDLPSGGTTGQILSKVDATDYNAQWVNKGATFLANDQFNVNTTPTEYPEGYSLMVITGNNPGWPKNSGQVSTEKGGNNRCTQFFISSSNGHRFYRYYQNGWSPWLDPSGSGVSILIYGASTSAVDNTSAIQATINQVSSTGGGEVYVPPGTFKTGRLDLPAKVSLVGEGMGVSTLQCLPNQTSAMVVISSTSNYAGIDNLTLDYTPGSHPTVHPSDPSVTPNYQGAVTVAIAGSYNFVSGVEIIASSLDAVDISTGAINCRAINNVVRGADRGGIVAAGTQASPARQILMYGNRVTGTYASGLMANGAIVDSIISNNIVLSTGGSGDGIAAYSPFNSQLSICDNVIKATGNNSMHIGGNHITITGNNMNNPAEFGISFANGDQSTAIGFVIANNRISNAGREGISARYVNQGTITGNSINNTVEHSIEVGTAEFITVTGNSCNGVSGAGFHGVLMAGARDCTVSSNQIYSVNTDGIRGEDRLGRNSQRIICSGNGIRDTGGWGIRTIDTSNRWIVTGTMFTNTSLGTFTLTGANNTTNANN